VGGVAPQIQLSHSIPFFAIEWGPSRWVGHPPLRQPGEGSQRARWKAVEQIMFMV